VGSNQLPVKWVLGFFFLGIKWLRREVGLTTYWSEKVQKNRTILLFTSYACVEGYRENFTLDGTVDSPRNIFIFGYI
jgi:hypothetical protein